MRVLGEANDAENKRARKQTKRSPKRLLNPDVYKRRFSRERFLPGSTNFVPCSFVSTEKQLTL